MMKFEEYQQYDLLGLRDLIFQKSVSASEVLETAILACETMNPAVNAVTHRMYDLAREQLVHTPHDATLYGVPFLLKDLSLNYAGVPTTQGSRFFKSYVPQQNSELVNRYQKAGLIIMGKTNTPELGSNWITESVLLGACRNPYDLTKTPGGSSGGSAAAVAAGIVPAAHASDGGGSIRVPAACCGLVGLKPSRGRISAGPERGEGGGGLSIHHAVTRTVRDTAILLDISKGNSVGDPYASPPGPVSYLEAMQLPISRQLKIALITEAPGGYPVNDECRRAAEHVATQSASLGANIESVSWPIAFDELKWAIQVIWAGQIAESVTSYAKASGSSDAETKLEPPNLFMYKLGLRLTAQDYVHAIQVMNRITRSMAQMMQSYDLILTPTLAQLPVDIGDLFYESAQGSIADFYKNRCMAFAPFTEIFNVTGQPAISFPAGFSKTGLPLGVQFAAKFGDELLLLQWVETFLE